MAETRVIAPRVGTDIVRSIFMGVRTRRSGAYTIGVDSGALVGADDGTDTMSLGTNLTIDGSTVGVDGLDTGTLSDDTWYAIWLIKEPNGLVHGLLSTSFSSPVLPGGYTMKRRIGSTYYDDDAGYFQKYEQIGQRITWEDEKLLYSSGNMPTGTWINLSLTSSAPPTVGLGYFMSHGPYTASNLYISYDGAGLHFMSCGGNDGEDRNRGDGFAAIILTYQHVYIYRSGHGNENPVTIWISGYEDKLY